MMCKSISKKMSKKVKKALTLKKKFDIFKERCESNK